MLKTLSVSAAALILITGAPMVANAAPKVASDEAKMEKMHRMKPTTLTLSETAEVRSTPDVAYITFGVVTEAKTAEAAMQANATRMNVVMAAVKAQGIAEKDVQTSGLNLNAMYDYPEKSPPVLRGYQVSNRISVQVNDVKKLGSAIDAVVKAGINQIDGVSFGLKDSDAAKDQARAEATKTLLARAELYAKSLGLKVKRISAVSETAGYDAPAPMPMYKMAAADMRESTPISAGEVSTTLTLNAEFELE